MSSIIYLNNAATSWPKAPGVSEAVAAALLAPPVLPGRDVSEGIDPLATCRQLLADRLAVPNPSRIVLTSGATQSLNLALLGLDLKPGQWVVTTQTEHNSVLRPLYRLQDQAGIHLEIIGLKPDGCMDILAYQEALRKKPALVVINHASNVTGRIQPVAELFAQAHHSGALTLLDASQSIGHIPVHPLELQADLVAIPGHKGLLGPAGTGALYAAEGIELKCVITGGTGVRSDLPHQPTEMPIRLEAGTPAIPNFCGLATALKWLSQHETSFVQQEKNLSHQLYTGLQNIPGVHQLTRNHPEEFLGVFSIWLDGWEVEEAGYVLSQSFDIECRTGLHCAPLIHPTIGSAPGGTLRLSLSGFNTAVEIGRTLEAILQLTQSI